MQKLKSSAPAPEPAPTHLSDRSRQLWDSHAPTMTPAQLVLLRLALEILDQAESARQLVAAEGTMVTTAKSGVTHQHPALRLQREASMQFAKLWKQLGLVAVAHNPFNF